jgi:hypothetical protein
MKNLLALIGLVVVVGGGVGWYMGWYKLSFTRGSDGNLEIKTDVDPKKVETDSTTFFKNAASVVGKHIDKTAKDSNTATPDTAPGATPGPIAPAAGLPTVSPAPIAPVAAPQGGVGTPIIPIAPPAVPTLGSAVPMPM